MIIRAISDSDSDDELYSARAGAAASSRSVFDVSDADTASSASTSVRCAWLAACGAAVVLLFVDVAALLTPSSDGLFALLPVAVSLALHQEPFTVSLDAFILNQCVGLVLVGAWILSREQSFATTSASTSTASASASAFAINRTTHWCGSARYGVWTVGALLCCGHVVSCLYVLFALLESNGDHVKFWLGQRRAKVKHQSKPYGRA